MEVNLTRKLNLKNQLAQEIREGSLAKLLWMLITSRIQFFWKMYDITGNYVYVFTTP